MGFKEFDEFDDFYEEDEFESKSDFEKIQSLNKCKCKKCDCLCNLLNKFAKNKDVILKTKSGDMIEGELLAITKDCCAVVLEPEMLTPYMEKRITAVRCEDIESFSIELPHNSSC
ncbi:hypothetical protein N780_17795 [Pontibacillus chungwhensis BH030062]|uniref:Uncharacterized protein n=1 Tax=Pontibacillus chungwhensis BH030062 TaxID=1385513 RepID=A0A0A2US65_9BACI|nr:hypothetical protein [Pontibacillus chungwhensis]KGP91152.1 hypothetical protein N780_17795 [Pontibacillus chungwhensis BH030062]